MVHVRIANVVCINSYSKGMHVAMYVCERECLREIEKGRVREGDREREIEREGLTENRSSLPRSNTSVRPPEASRDLAAMATTHKAQERSTPLGPSPQPTHPQSLYSNRMR